MLCHAACHPYINTYTQRLYSFSVLFCRDTLVRGPHHSLLVAQAVELRRLLPDEDLQPQRAQYHLQDLHARHICDQTTFQQLWLHAMTFHQLCLELTTSAQSCPGHALPFSLPTGCNGGTGTHRDPSRQVHKLIYDFVHGFPMHGRWYTCLWLQMCFTQFLYP